MDINNLNFVSSGLCPNCEDCADIFGIGINELNQGIENGDIFDEGSFSWNPCSLDDCSNHGLGGNSHIAHGKDKDGELAHFTVCIDCLFSIQ